MSAANVKRLRKTTATAARIGLLRRTPRMETALGGSMGKTYSLCNNTARHNLSRSSLDGVAGAAKEAGICYDNFQYSGVSTSADAWFLQLVRQR